MFDGRERLTFGEAQVLAHRFGNAVIEELGGPAAHVALYMRNQVEFFPVFYGALAAGGVAVPLNADARGPLLERVIVKSDARVLVARADLLDDSRRSTALGAVELVLVAGAGGRAAATVCRRARAAAGAAGSTARRDPPAELPDSADTALIQFTSGTTGASRASSTRTTSSSSTPRTSPTPRATRRTDVLSSPLPAFHVAALHIIANSALHAGCVAHLKSRFSARDYWTRDRRGRGHLDDPPRPDRGDPPEDGRRGARSTG